MDFDVIFIGSGHANWHAAVSLSQAGKKVAIVEEDLVAGTCTNYGCAPKILLDGPMELIHEMQQYPDALNGKVSVDWTELMNLKESIINQLPKQMEKMFEVMGITLIEGHGFLTDKNSVSVDSKTYSADYIVVGTGEHSRRLDIPGKEYLNDSRDFLSLKAFPKRITFVGAGIISLEFASMAVSMDAEVTIIEHSSDALASFNQKYVNKIVESLRTAGVNFKFSTSVVEVRSKNKEYIVQTDQQELVRTDYVINATGRVPNVKGIGLATVGVDYSARRGIVTDKHLRTNVPNIFASGDVLDKQVPKLTPTATFESNYIANQILGNTDEISYPVIPSVVYTLPRISQVGVSSALGNKEGHLLVRKINYGKQIRFQSKNEIESEVTIILDKNTGTLVGAEIYGNDAPDMINILTIIINQKMKASDLKDMVFAFPSTSSGIISLLISAMQIE